MQESEIEKKFWHFFPRLNNVRHTLKRFLNGNIYHGYAMIFTVVLLLVSIFAKDYKERSDSLLICYNQTQIVDNCFDDPSCYNTTLLQDCFQNQFNYDKSLAKDYKGMFQTWQGLGSLYMIGAGFIIIEAVIRFIICVQVHAVYDFTLTIGDFALSLYSISTGDWYFFAMFMPIRLILFISDLSILQPILYYISLSVGTLFYLFLYLTGFLYSASVVSFLAFNPRWNPDRNYIYLLLY
jgi:hypothetical protein